MLVTSCTFDEVVDPNGPSADGVQSEASIGQLNELVVGVESSARNGVAIETTASGTMARELYLFDADPRNTGDLLGKNGIGLDNNSFYSTAQWNGSYRCIKNANLLISAATNTSAITNGERNGYIGFAKTIIAYELIQMAKSYGQARVDVADEENLGPIVGEAEVLAAARAMLNEANSELNSGTFLFSLSAGFAGFDTAGSFGQFNRGVAAMAAVYAGDGPGALSALGNSHFNLNGDLSNGPKHLFAPGGNDALNGLFKLPSTSVEDQNNGDQIIVHDSWINDAEAGDTRVATKAAPRPDPSASLDDLTGTHETRLYASSTDFIDFLRNEELILLYVEASILAGNLGNAENGINVIRNSAGLANYSGANSAAALTTEMLNQRRYSLWCENHRMYDLRRYGLSSTLPIDRAGDQVFNQLPVPLAENN
ncbi:MAG: hypothetical protein Aureis2KO_26920 [Aureisphaera sp.]